MNYTLSCHCGAFTAQVEAPAEVEVHDCNCSVCAKSGHLHLILPKNRITDLEGFDRLGLYTFNTGVAKHYFCKTCGIRPFYTPRSNPDGIDVNARCLSPQPEAMTVIPFDGQNWEANAATLSHLSVGD